MSARYDATINVVAGLDPVERARLAVALVGELDADGLAQIGVALVRRLDALAKVDPAAADQLGQAVMATFRDLPSTMAGALTASIQETPS